MKKASLTAALFLVACVGCHESQQILPDQAAPIAAKVVLVATVSASSTHSVEGVVTALQSAIISSQVMAPIASLQVREGDVVRKGEVLIRLSSAPLQAAVDQSRAQLQAASTQQAAAESQKKLAAQTYARYASLNEKHSVTPHEFDQVKAQLDAASAASQASVAQVAAAQAAARGAEATSSYTVIRAPFSGLVTKKFVDSGTMATPGAPLLQIEDARRHEVDLQVNENALGEFHPGRFVQVSVNGAPVPITGKVSEIVPGGDPAAHSFTVKIGLPAVSEIYSGMTARVAVPGSERLLLEVPSSAVRHRGQLESVLALDRNSVAQLRYVSLGQIEGLQVEVISGLAAGDRILAQPDDAWIGHRIEQQP